MLLLCTQLLLFLHYTMLQSWLPCSKQDCRRSQENTQHKRAREGHRFYIGYRVVNGFTYVKRMRTATGIQPITLADVFSEGQPPLYYNG
eukprot:1141262-Pelagomonas_calceolata.AAC.11